jgi:hypothetical protein
MAFTNPIFVDADGDGALRWFPTVDAGVPAQRDSGRVEAAAADSAVGDGAASDGAVSDGGAPGSER